MWNVYAFDLVTKKSQMVNDCELTFEDALELIRLIEDNESLFLLLPV